MEIRDKEEIKFLRKENNKLRLAMEMNENHWISDVEFYEEFKEIKKKLSSAKEIIKRERTIYLLETGHCGNPEQEAFNAVKEEYKDLGPWE
jgi:hypothetical protein